MYLRGMAWFNHVKQKHETDKSMMVHHDTTTQGYGLTKNHE